VSLLWLLATGCFFGFLGRCCLDGGIERLGFWSMILATVFLLFSSFVSSLSPVSLSSDSVFPVEKFIALLESGLVG